MRPRIAGETPKECGELLAGHPIAFARPPVGDLHHRAALDRGLKLPRLPVQNLLDRLRDCAWHRAPQEQPHAKRVFAGPCVRWMAGPVEKRLHILPAEKHTGDEGEVCRIELPDAAGGALALRWRAGSPTGTHRAVPISPGRAVLVAERRGGEDARSLGTIMRVILMFRTIGPPPPRVNGRVRVVQGDAPGGRGGRGASKASAKRASTAQPHRTIAPTHPTAAPPATSHAELTRRRSSTAATAPIPTERKLVSASRAS